MKKFDQIDFITKLTALSSRQGKSETKASRMIQSVLRRNDLDFRVEKFRTLLPEAKMARLLADGRDIPCRATTFVSGTIRDKEHIISSLTSSQPFIKTANINFSPLRDTFSLANHYFAPAVAVDHKGLRALLLAKKVWAETKINKVNHISENILVGSLDSPKCIVFAHYDSVGPGAIDNASGVAVVLKYIIENRQSLNDNLFVFAGNEELSYDHPIYWGHGFRVFEKKHGGLFDSAKKIIALDCVGNGKTEVSRDRETMPLAFPIQNMDKYAGKIVLMHGDIAGLMAVYHSPEDTIENLNQKDLDGAVRSLHKLIESQ